MIKSTLHYSTLTGEKISHKDLGSINAFQIIEATFTVLKFVEKFLGVNLPTSIKIEQFQDGILISEVRYYLQTRWVHENALIVGYTAKGSYDTYKIFKEGTNERKTKKELLEALKRDNLIE